MARFTLPRDLYHGPHALEALKTLPGKRAMIQDACASESCTSKGFLSIRKSTSPAFTMPPSVYFLASKNPLTRL